MSHECIRCILTLLSRFVWSEDSELLQLYCPPKAFRARSSHTSNENKKQSCRRPCTRSMSYLERMVPALELVFAWLRLAF